MKRINSWVWQDVEQTTSTNDAIKEWLAELNQPCVFTAKEQTAGRGRRGRTWISQEGNLFMSLALKFDVKDLGQLVILSGLAVYSTVKHFCPEAHVQVKWPNDVLVDGAKISGILFEAAENDFWIMGIGINIVSSPQTSQAGYKTAGLNALGAQTERLSVLKVLLENFETLLSQYSLNGFDRLKQSWLDKAYNLGQKVIIKQEKGIKEGIFENLDNDGSLWLKTSEGVEKIVVGDLFVKEEMNEKIK